VSVAPIAGIGAGSEAGMAIDQFDGPDAGYLVLCNEEGRYSLWPAFAQVPVGWTVVPPEPGGSDGLEHLLAGWPSTSDRPLAGATRAAASVPGPL
jgi:MbtH protein